MLAAPALLEVQFFRVRMMPTDPGNLTQTIFFNMDFAVHLLL